MDRYGVIKASEKHALTAAANASRSSRSCSISASTSLGSTSTVTNCLRNFRRLRKRRIRSAGAFGLRICGVSCGEEGIILPISFMRLSVHCQSPELRQPAWAGKVGASGPPAHLRGGPSPVHFLLGTHQSGRARRDSDRGDVGLLRLSGGALAPKRLQSPSLCASNHLGLDTGHG